jgi:hypothetical protein
MSEDIRPPKAGRPKGSNGLRPTNETERRLVDEAIEALDEKELGTKYRHDSRPPPAPTRRAAP